MSKDSIIDTAARQQASKLLREFMEGRVSNTDLDAGYPQASEDRAVHAIYRRTWRYQDDHREYRAVGETALSSSEAELMRRCVLFLESGLPYEWPSMMDRVRSWFSLDQRSDPGDSSSSGEEGQAIWPFFRADDWKRAQEGGPPRA